MYLSRFGVKNYKCLADIDIPLTPIHVLIGPNDAGKTSLLEAIAAFYASADRALPQTLPAPWGGRDLVSHWQSAPTVEFSGEWRTETASESASGNPDIKYGYGLEFAVIPDIRQCGKYGEWLQGDTDKWLLDRYLGPGSDSTAFCHWRRGLKWPDQMVPSLGTLSQVLKPTHKYALDPKVMAIPCAIDVLRKYRLDPDGFGLPTLLMDILTYDATRFLNLRQQFCELFPEFASVRMETERAHRRDYDHEGAVAASASSGAGHGIFFESVGGATIRAQQASDGAILFLGFLALAHLPEPPTLLLIEEPENGVYPKRLAEVIRLLKGMIYREEGPRFPQIILTTHSPFVLSFFEPEEVTFLSRDPKHPEKAVRARPMRDAPKIRERLAGGAFYLGELWYNLSEEDLFGGP